MQLNEFKSAWQQLKVINSLEPVVPQDILTIIDDASIKSVSKRQLLVNIAMFIALVMICQGG